MLLVAGVLLLGGCRSVDENAHKIPSVSLSNEKLKLDPSVAELKRLYESTQSEYERRTVCLRAIDKGAIRRGVHIRSVDQIFGTNLESQWGARKVDGVRVGVVHFVPDVEAPLPARSDQKTEGRGFFGWFLGLDYDDKGVVQSYDLSNIHKGDSRGEPGRNPSPVAELKAQYAAAKSESDYWQERSGGTTWADTGKPHCLPAVPSLVTH